MAKSIVIRGNVYADTPSIEAVENGTGNHVLFHDTTDATATAADITLGKTAYLAAGETVGTMADNGDVSGTISTKAGTVTIPAGKTSGGTVGIADTEKAKIIADNIKAGVTLLGQAGKSTVVDTEIATGGATASTILRGSKAYVNGTPINGTAVMPVISQDSTTRILSIS